MRQRDVFQVAGQECCQNRTTSCSYKQCVCAVAAINAVAWVQSLAIGQEHIIRCTTADVVDACCQNIVYRSNRDADCCGVCTAITVRNGNGEAVRTVEVCVGRVCVRTVAVEDQRTMIHVVCQRECQRIAIYVCAGQLASDGLVFEACDGVICNNWCIVNRCYGHSCGCCGSRALAVCHGVLERVSAVEVGIWRVRERRAIYDHCTVGWVCRDRISCCVVSIHIRRCRRHSDGTAIFCASCCYSRGNRCVIGARYSDGQHTAIALAACSCCERNRQNQNITGIQ